MFERYTEKARRVIFFSRSEASQFGSPYIETEHLLLGILRECKDAMRLFGDKLFSYEELRTRVEQLSLQPRERVTTSVDLPLSNESKRALAYAAEEAERLEDKHIGAEHLFLGLLREEGSLACQLLNERGITLKEARQKIAADLGVVVPSPGYTYTTGREAIEIHGIQWDAGRVRWMVAELIRFAWEKRSWKPCDILTDRQTGRVMFYTGQEFDTTKFELVRGGWKRDYCAICNWELTESDEPQHGLGYTNGRDWICTECYDKFFHPPITSLHDLYT